MINGILLLFLAYLNPNADLQTTLIDNVSISAEEAPDVKIIKNKKDLEVAGKVYGSELKLPGSYFFDEVLVIKKLENKADPKSFTIISASKNKDGNYEIFYSVTEKDNNDIQSEKSAASKDSFAIVKLKPLLNKEAKINFVKIDMEDPIFVNQSINVAPSLYSNVQTQPREIIFHDFFPLDKGNTWTYLYTDGNSKKELTSKIVSFTKGWSVFDNFFGKPKMAFQVDYDGNLMTSSKSGIRSFYNDSVKIENSANSFSVEAGTFSNVLIVSIPKNDKFWFTDIYAKNVGLIYHEHHSTKGSFFYELKNANVRGKSIP